MPLIIVPATGGDGAWFAVFLSGDGGWTALDRGVSRELVKQHIPVVGWDSLKYFWTARTAQGVADDLDRVVRLYAKQWGKSRVLLIGYSQGADIMPFMVNRLPPETRGRVGLTALLGISDNALFEFHVANWFGKTSGSLPTGPELKRMTGSPYVCLYGERDKDAACAQLTGGDGVAIEMPGGHHFGRAYGKIAEEILAHLPEVPPRGPP